MIAFPNNAYYPWHNSSPIFLKGTQLVLELWYDNLIKMGIIW